MGLKQLAKARHFIYPTLFRSRRLRILQIVGIASKKGLIDRPDRDQASLCRMAWYSGVRCKGLFFINIAMVACINQCRFHEDSYLLFFYLDFLNMTFLILIAALLWTSLGQVTEWGQCGGYDYTGPAATEYHLSHCFHLHKKPSAYAEIETISVDQIESSPCSPYYCS